MKKVFSVCAVALALFFVSPMNAMALNLVGMYYGTARLALALTPFEPGVNPADIEFYAYITNQDGNYFQGYFEEMYYYPLGDEQAEADNGQYYIYFSGYKDGDEVTITADEFSIAKGTIKEFEDPNRYANVEDAKFLYDLGILPEYFTITTEISGITQNLFDVATGTFTMTRVVSTGCPYSGK